MSEWWTYAAEDFLMFSPDTYYRLFELHNTGIWSAQALAILGALVILALLIRSRPIAGRAISLILAAAWAFVAWAYFHERYAAINLAAPAYAWLFAAQSGLLLISGIALNRLKVETGPLRVGGITIFILGLAVYPAVALSTGRPWPQSELFAIAPDPTVFATLGVLAAAARPSWELWIVPVFWCAITTLTLWTMGAPEAPLIVLAPALALAIVVYRNTSQPGAGNGKVNG